MLCTEPFSQRVQINQQFEFPIRPDPLLMLLSLQEANSSLMDKLSLMDSEMANLGLKKAELENTLKKSKQVGTSFGSRL